MTSDEMIKRLRPYMDNWPLGMTVYHRACGKRGVLMGFAIIIGGEVNFRIDYGGGGWANENPAAITATKPSDGTDGDEWKDTEETKV